MKETREFEISEGKAEETSRQVRFFITGYGVFSLIYQTTLFTTLLIRKERLSELHFIRFVSWNTH